MSPPDDHEEIVRLRQRLHEVVDNTSAQLLQLRGEIHNLTVQVEREIPLLKEHIRGLSRQIEEQSDDAKSLRRGVYTLAFSAIGAALVTVLAVSQLAG